MSAVPAESDEIELSSSRYRKANSTTFAGGPMPSAGLIRNSSMIGPRAYPLPRSGPWSTTGAALMIGAAASGSSTARVSDRVPEMRRSIERPHGARWECRGCLPSRHTFAPGLRLFRQTARERMDSTAHRAGVAHSDGPARLRPLCRAGRRLARRDYHRNGSAATERTWGNPPQIPLHHAGADRR